MPLVFNTKTYTANRFNGDSVGYIGTLKTVTKKDDLVLIVTPPKPTSTFSGVGRARAKLTRTLDLTGALTPTWEAIIDANVSVPSGFASADVDALLNDFGALISGADFKTVVKSLKVNF